MCKSAGEIDILAAFESADLLLPNADGEGESIRRDLSVSTPMVTVPNGVDPRHFSPPEVPFERRRAVLYVGRIEPHKNQLGLIDALRGSGIHLVIAGYAHPDHPEYARRCQRAGAGWTEFLTGFEHSAPELLALYRSARVHVLPSWFETTGLASLEAALCGCNIVSTTRGYAREYLGDLAWYCDPAQRGSILAAVQQAWESPPSDELRRRILDRYTWDHVAQATVRAYRSLFRDGESALSVLER